MSSASSQSEIFTVTYITSQGKLSFGRCGQAVQLCADGLWGVALACRSRGPLKPTQPLPARPGGTISLVARPDLQLIDSPVLIVTRILRAAKLIDLASRWIGGHSILIQTGGKTSDWPPSPSDPRLGGPGPPRGPLPRAWLKTEALVRLPGRRVASDALNEGRSLTWASQMRFVADIVDRGKDTIALYR